MSDASAGLTSLQFNVLNGAGALGLVLVVANIGLSLNNREAQAQVNARQQYINDTVQLSRLNTQIIQALANLSVQTGDESIQRLLAAQGITISTEAGAAEPAGGEEVQE